ncbi:MAG: hypothetical protein ACJ8F7_17030 [Gemmataceae bacterium]
MMRLRLIAAALASAALLAGSARADLAGSLKRGPVQLKSAGALAFGPENILFVGDSAAATVFALGTGDSAVGDRNATLNVEGINAKIAELLGTTPSDITINDMKVNPATGNVYLSVMRGKGTSAGAAIMRVDLSGKVTELDLKDIASAKVMLPNASEKQRAQTITSMAIVKDQLFVSGLSNEEFASTLRAIKFPFTEADKGTGIEIFHGAHGKLETASPIRTFTPFEINGEANLLASYTCTPLVKIPVSDLKPGTKVHGVTVAELGNMNQPLDMVVYQKDGKTFVLMANTKHGVIKVDTTGIDKAEPITTRINGKAGLQYESLKQYAGVVQLDRLNDGMALMLVKNGDSFNIKSIELP